MTDRVLTEGEVAETEEVAKLGRVSWGGPVVLALCASHRLLQKRVTELEERIGDCSGPCGNLP